MTQKIFYEDAYCREFDAVVVSCTEHKGRYEIILDRTAFYPEGGGQSGDTGTLRFPTDEGGQGSAEIFDTHETPEGIAHYSKTPVEAGTRVQGTIDWDRRFDLMQNHTGEHIVSGLIHEAYGYENVGFHMGSDMITIDLSGELTAQQLREIEAKANETVWRNVPVGIRVYDEESVKALTYRSKKELHGEVRIVTVPGADVCACCGTHVRTTGEIGLIKLISCEKFRGGVRVEMLCGRKALEYMNEVWEQNHRISVALSARPLATAEAVDRMKSAAAQDSMRMADMERRQNELEAAQLAGAGNCVLFRENLGADNVRRLAVSVMESCKGICAVFSGDDGSGYKYAAGLENGDIRSLVKEMNTELNGRGGGKPFFAQGSVTCTRNDIESFFSAKGDWKVV
ncbi:MAG: alanyl-tRNA editing protein [Lachnospiraceae bacterium]|nr:alanyl-tRNA editing protein [Lachnospiraceae bacterium]